MKFLLDEILELANQNKPKDYPTLEHKDVCIYMSKETDYGYYDDITTTVTLTIKIKNKDYIEK